MKRQSTMVALATCAALALAFCIVPTGRAQTLQSKAPATARPSSAVSPETVRQLPERFQRLKPGMDEALVFKTLGLPKHGAGISGRGGGPMHAYLMGCRIEPYGLGLVWDGRILKSALLQGNHIKLEIPSPK